jgi:hypothetical protein
MGQNTVKKRKQESRMRKQNANIMAGSDPLVSDGSENPQTHEEIPQTATSMEAKKEPAKRSKKTAQASEAVILTRSTCSHSQGVSVFII